jgi:hypothetical protein
MGTRKLRRGALVAAVVAGALGVTAVAYADLTQTPVKNNPYVGEIDGFQNDTYLAFTRNSTAHPKDYALYLQARAGGPVTRVNPEKTRGYAGAIDGTTLIYQQVNKGQSDVKMYDINAQTRSNPPTGINTSEWEYFPQITPDWILFLRSGHGSDRVMLYDRNLGGAPQQIDSVNWNRSGTASIFAAQMNGNYATWTKCTSSTVCKVRIRDLSAGTIRTIVPPAGKMDYASSVGTDGTVYLVRSGNTKCGVGVRLRAISPLGVDSLLVEFSPGVDVIETSTHSTGMSDEVLYGKYRCSAGSSHADLYQVTNPI